MLERLGRFVDAYRGSPADDAAARAGPKAQEDKRSAPIHKEPEIVR